MPFESGANLVNWVCNFRPCLVVGQLKDCIFGIWGLNGKEMRGVNEGSEEQ